MSADTNTLFTSDEVEEFLSEIADQFDVDLSDLERDKLRKTLFCGLTTVRYVLTVYSSSDLDLALRETLGECPDCLSILTQCHCA